MGKKAKRAPKLLKLDLGCGQNRREGFTGVDVCALPGVDVVHDLFKFPWPFKAESVEEAFSSHFFEHVPGRLRMPFMDELHRVLIPGGKAEFIFPYWSSMRAVQDPTHEWPPVCEMSFLYFNAGWRKMNKLEHYAVKCDFDYAYAFQVNPAFGGRSQEFLQGAIPTMTNVVNDLSVTLVKREQS